ncbi:MAG: hypothetical protein ACJ77D_13990 [Chloroflexota bacterium]
MPDLHDAVDDWLEAKRELDRALPWSAEWLRLRIIEQDRRTAYLALMEGGPASGSDELPRTAADPEPTA